MSEPGWLRISTLISGEARGSAVAPSTVNLARTPVSTVVWGSVENPLPTCSPDLLLKETAVAEDFSHGGVEAGCSYLFPQCVREKQTLYRPGRKRRVWTGVTDVYKDAWEQIGGRHCLNYLPSDWKKGLYLPYPDDLPPAPQTGAGPQRKHL